MPLEPEDQKHLTAAEGYAQLGMYLDANEELENRETALEDEDLEPLWHSFTGELK